MNYAGFWIRAIAYLIDFILINAVEYGVEEGLCTLLGIGAFGQQILGVFLSLIFYYLYYVEIPQKRGTTFGKQIFGIYVVDQKTGAIFSRKQAVVRVFGYLISFIILGCGFLMVAFNPTKQGLHDLLAGTISVRRKKGSVVDAETISASDPTTPEKTDGAH